MNIHTDLTIYAQNVEKSLFFYIIANIEHNLLSVEDAQVLAENFLSLLPPSDKEAFLANIYSLGDKYREAYYVYLRYGGEYEEEKRNRKLQMIRMYLQTGNIEQAILVAKGGEHS
jgi:hypothetical protein